jgi:hypothetical protein
VSAIFSKLLTFPAPQPTVTTPSFTRYFPMSHRDPAQSSCIRQHRVLAGRYEVQESDPSITNGRGNEDDDTCGAEYFEPPPKRVLRH